MTAAQKAAKANFKKAIEYRKKTGVSLKEAFAHVYGKKVGAAPKKKAAKKAAPKKAAKKVVKKAAPKKVAKKAAPKKVAKKKHTKYGKVKAHTRRVAGVHKDTKSHNVNIRVISGLGSKMMARISPVGYVYASSSYGKSGLQQFLKENVGKFIEIDTSHLFNNQYNTTNGYRIYDTMIDAIKNDARTKGKGYGPNKEVEDIAFLDWQGIKPIILPVPAKKFGTYEFETYPSLNYYRLRNARQTINFIYYNGKYYISNGIGYKVRSKVSSTYSGDKVPEKVKNDLDKYLKSFY
jgi:hypothetical protein